MRSTMIFLTGVMLVVLSGCSDYIIPAPECPQGETDVSFSADVQPIFDRNCTLCHPGSHPLDLSKGWAFEELSDGGYLDTDSPCSSILYDALVNKSVHSGKFSDEELLVILGWIQEGALDN